MQFNTDFDYMRMRPDQRKTALPGYVAASEQKNTDIPSIPSQTPLGMAYVPFQSWGEVYDADRALPIGTIFQELDYPFLGRSVHDA